MGGGVSIVGGGGYNGGGGASTSGGGSGGDSTRSGGDATGTSSPSLSRLLRETDLPSFDPDHGCYLEMVLHYAFVTLFSLSCPAVPVLSLLR